MLTQREIMEKPVLDKERMARSIVCIIKRSIVSVLVVCLLCSLATPAFGGTYTCPENPLLPYVNSLVPQADNSHFPVVSKPKSYAYSPMYKKAPYSEKANTLTPASSIGLADTYTTSFFLPLRFSKVGAAYNPQSVVFVGSYVYVLYSKGSTTNSGFLVRYNYDLMKKYGLTSGSGISRLRAAVAGKIAPSASITKNTKSITTVKKKLKKKGLKAAQRKKLKKKLAVLRKQKVKLKKKAAEQTKIRKVVKVGPTITIGHGQSLAYNPVRKELWMWRDLHNADGTWKEPQNSSLQRISMSTFKVDAIVNFRMAAGVNNTPQTGLHNLAFDKNGNAYFWRPGDTVNRIYRAQITPNSIRVEHVQTFTRRPGTYAQSLGYNAVTDRLYFVSDDSITTVPVSELGHLEASDMTSTTYSSKREFEGLTFDPQGYGYLLLNRGPEILRSTAPSALR